MDDAAHRLSVTTLPPEAGAVVASLRPFLVIALSLRMTRPATGTGPAQPGGW